MKWRPISEAKRGDQTEPWVLVHWFIKGHAATGIIHLMFWDGSFGYWHVAGGTDSFTHGELLEVEAQFTEIIWPERP